MVPPTSIRILKAHSPPAAVARQSAPFAGIVTSEPYCLPSCAHQQGKGRQTVITERLVDDESPSHRLQRLVAAWETESIYGPQTNPRDCGSAVISNGKAVSNGRPTAASALQAALPSETQRQSPRRCGPPPPSSPAGAPSTCTYHTHICPRSGCMPRPVSGYAGPIKAQSPDTSVALPFLLPPPPPFLAFWCVYGRQLLSAMPATPDRHCGC